MLFNSYIFIFAFLPSTFVIYFYILQRGYDSGAKLFLVFASLFFYSWWNVAYLPIMIGSILFNYFFGRLLSQHANKIFLAIGVLANLSLLGYFKYRDFFVTNFNVLTDSHISLLHLALPLAISFFTFQQIAYLVDSYRQLTHEYNWLDYTLFVTFFPQLIAGPIVHHKEMMPQFEQKENLIINSNHIAKGLFLFTLGLFKKVAIADTFALQVHQGFDVSDKLDFVSAWLSSLSYTFQLYYDFSGYTDMAIGLALLFNIRLPINFNSPYKAVNIQDFWRRWHMTLSRFLKDYIYIPLGGNRKGEARTYLNLFITFLLGGIWHGAGWTFVFWGILHGVALILHRLWQKLRINIPMVLAWFITFNFINIAWVFFRAHNFHDALKVLYGMIDISSLNVAILTSQHYMALFFVVMLGVTFFTPNSMAYANKFQPTRLRAIMIGALFGLSLLFLTRASEFLYFNF